ncbi:MAG: hypothetical protein AB7I13_22230, partial [Vicinamibacterales bacterium]
MPRVVRACERCPSKLLAALVLVLVALTSGSRVDAQNGSGQHWVGTWATALMARVPAGDKPDP